MSVEQIVVGSPTTHDIVVYVDGTPSNLDSVPTYAITDADGTAVASGTATTIGTGVYRIAVAAPSEVAIWTVEWAGALSGLAWSAVTTIEVVGAVMFGINELRTFRNGDLASTTTYPNADIIDVRAAITDEFADIIGVSPVPRYYRERVAGAGTRHQYVTKRRITSVLGCTISDVAITPSYFDPDPLLPVIYRTNGRFTSASYPRPRNITVSYRHGYETVPPDLHRAALIVARERLIADVMGNGIPDRASSWTDAAGSFQAFAARADTGRWYGMPTVDIPLARHRDMNIVPIGG